MCGIVGVYSENAAWKAKIALGELQHRGKEGAGIVSFDGNKFHAKKGVGLVEDAVEDISGLEGLVSIGHVRYSTQGGTDSINTQPFHFPTRDLAIAHNGNIVNYDARKEALERKNALLITLSDSELFVHDFIQSKSRDLDKRVFDACKENKGAYSLVMINQGKLIGVRDPQGFRPLSLGKMQGGYILSSESGGFDVVDADHVRDIEPGEIIVIDETGPRSYHPESWKNQDKAHCVFELVYFSRPDGRIFGGNVDTTRRAYGKVLAQEHPMEVDVVMGVPDSGITSALGYYQELKVRFPKVEFDIGILRNHYVGRTFILPGQNLREAKVSRKFKTIGDSLKGKKIAIIDDSIVRGTTLNALIKRLREKGAHEVYVGITSPPVKSPCFYGINTPTKRELAVNELGGVKAVKSFINADSLFYLSSKGMLSVSPKIEGSEEGYCTACFSGEYPVHADFIKKVIENQ